MACLLPHSCESTIGDAGQHVWPSMRSTGAQASPCLSVFCDPPRAYLSVHPGLSVAVQQVLSHSLGQLGHILLVPGQASFPVPPLRSRGHRQRHTLMRAAFKLTKGGYMAPDFGDQRKRMDMPCRVFCSRTW